MKTLFFLMFNFIFCTFCFSEVNGNLDNKCTEDFITIAILVKDKEPVLPLYLECIENQTWPKKRTYLYIRTNNNNDNSATILKNWIEKVKNEYAKIYFDDSDVTEQVQQFKPHEWNQIRFKVLGKIRQDSVDWAKKNDSHYFVVDCDNFIHPHTLQKIFDVNLPIVAPLLRINNSGRAYSNVHVAIDDNGYYADSEFYIPIVYQKIKGLIEVPVVHCTYLVRKEFFDKITYDDDSARYEYVIFSDSARKNNIPQYFDNRELYGRITFVENKEELLKEDWLNDFIYLKSGQQLILEQRNQNNALNAPENTVNDNSQ